jgi:hypothetical protein
MANVTSINFSGDETSELAVKIKSALDKALADDHKLPNSVLRLHGMSGKKYRMLINNLIASISDARYLEIGTWAGSTACSAMFGNVVNALCIDNWSQFGGPKDAFHHNVNAILTPAINFNFIESDFRQVDFANIGKFNVYMFDGPHEQDDQYDGIAMAMPALDDQFILIVDDWNWIQPRDGTMGAIAKIGLKVLTSVEIRTTDDDTDGAIFGENGDWHNGYFIAVVSKA